MNWWLFIAGLCSLATAALHVFGGGPEINDVVQTSDLPLLVRSVSIVVWHGITAILLINGLTFIHAALSTHSQSAARLAILQYLIFAGIFVFFDLSRFGALMAMPQWTLFIGMAVIAAIGCRKPRAASL